MEKLKKKKRRVIHYDKIVKIGYKKFKENFISELDFENDLNKKITFYLNNNNEEKVTLSVPSFTVNLIFLRLYMENEYEIDRLSIFEDSINADTIEGHFNYIIEHFRDVLDIGLIKKGIKETIEDLVRFSAKCNYYISSSINLYDLVKLSTTNKEFDELIHYKVDPEDTISVCEEKLKEASDRLIEILKVEDTCLKSFLNAKVGVKPKQLREAILNIGFKPDIHGNIIPEPINTNFLFGYRDEIDFFNNAIGTRKALILNYKYTKRSGYLTRKLETLTTDCSFSHKNHCDTKHHLKVIVEDEDHLDRMHGRYYLTKTKKIREIKRTNLKLIGKKIRVFSPITCGDMSLGNGQICSRCYGKMYDINKQFNPGILATLFLTNPFTQNILSSKHLINISTATIIWDERIKDYFIIQRNSLKIRDDKIFTIIIKEGDLEIDEMKNKIFTKRMTIKEKEKKIEFDFPLDIYYPKEHKEGKIKLKSSEKGCFEFIVENKEFSKNLERIIKVLETNEHIVGNDYNDIYNTFIRILMENGISIASVHTETILSRLVRSRKNHSKFIDFNKKKIPEYDTLRVTNAILESDSVALGLSFERISQQMLNPQFYLKKGSSLLELFYK